MGSGVTFRIGLLLAVCVSPCLVGCASPGSQATTATSSQNSLGVAQRVRTDLPEPLLQPARPQNLTAVSYNVHLLPSVALPFAGERSAAEYRAKKIADQLAGHDLIGLCEAFDATHRQAMIDQLQANTGNGYHVAHGPGRSGSHWIGGGLLFLSKYPILETHTRTYQNATGLLTHGLKADGFAAKGALHVRVLVDLPSQLAVDCFVTHLDSQSASVRRLQVEEFCQFVAQHQHSDNPAVLLGDFNIAADTLADSESEYSNLTASIDRLRSLPFVDVARRVSFGPVGTSDALAEDGGRRIDYLFTSNSTNPAATQLACVQVSIFRCWTSKSRRALFRITWPWRASSAWSASMPPPRFRPLNGSSHVRTGVATQWLRECEQTLVRQDVPYSFCRSTVWPTNVGQAVPDEALLNDLPNMTQALLSRLPNVTQLPSGTA